MTVHLTLNVEDLSDLVIHSSSGEQHQLIKVSDLSEIRKTLQEARRYNRKFYNQTEVTKLYKVSRETIRRWVAQGLSEVSNGKSILYDRDEIDAFLESKKK